MPGFRLICAEDHAPDELLALCRGARALVGLHGAALTNQIFCRPGTAVVEVFPRINFPFYARLAGVCGHRQTAVIAPENPAASEVEQLAEAVAGLLASHV